MRMGKNGLQCLLLIAACLTVSSCATQKFYHGIEATNLSGLFYGMKRHDAEKVTGSALKEVKRGSGVVVTYLYDRGWIGCVGEGGCEAEDESKLQAAEIVADIFSLGTFSYALNQCKEPCQKGHLEVFYNDKNVIIGARERPAKKEGYCWGRWNKRSEGYPCFNIYDNRRPSSVSPQLILFSDAITGKTAAQWELYEQSKSRDEHDFRWLCKAADRGDYRAR